MASNQYQALSSCMADVETFASKRRNDEKARNEYEQGPLRQHKLATDEYNKKNEDWKKSAGDFRRYKNRDFSTDEFVARTAACTIVENGCARYTGWNPERTDALCRYEAYKRGFPYSDEIGSYVWSDHKYEGCGSGVCDTMGKPVCKADPSFFKRVRDEYDASKPTPPAAPPAPPTPTALQTPNLQCCPNLPVDATLSDLDTCAANTRLQLQKLDADERQAAKTAFDTLQQECDTTSTNMQKKNKYLLWALMATIAIIVLSLISMLVTR